MTHWGRAVGLEMHVVSPTQTNESWWIDDEGQWRPCFDEQGRAFLFGGQGACHKDKAVAFRLFGMIYCERNTDTYYFAWDVNKVSPNGVAVLSDRLSTLPDTAMVNLSYDYGGWTHHKHLCPKRALSVLRNVTDYKDLSPMGFVRSSRKSLKSLAKSHPFYQVFVTWWRTAGKTDQFPADQMHYLLDHGTIMSPDQNDGPFWVRHIGGASPIGRLFGHDQIGQSVGCRLDNSPVADLYYEREVGASYQSVLNAWKPRLDDVMALMHLPNREAEWVPYRRLILPLRGKRNRHSVAILTDFEGAVSIPFLDEPLDQRF